MELLYLLIFIQFLFLFYLLPFCDGDDDVFYFFCGGDDAF